ncbi:hypothetical protein DJ021_07745 [Phenylobacterium hankyongense]|uniref:DUF3800 domain-containing protein n=1 Tax=Phenylobacterium hankyongense TaxID=1813876 RepID=A0A328AX56_9CAUL|nr:DUF3800 domain-containing protein [Phenylobacterium hankyongense]RAK59702.1 hypothetical protein DJ021_07745 [Phenylobacterium hankyongense]
MYRLYVDEVGTDDLTHIEKDSQRYLSLTGVAMRIDHARDQLMPNMNWIKANVLKHDPDSPIILHRKDIVARAGGFQCLNDEKVCDPFDRSILRLMKRAEYSVITALIDKQWMLKQQHWQKTHPYHYLMEIMIEKYVQFLERMDVIGDIMPESRMGKSNERLQRACDDVRLTGTRFVSAERIASAVRGPKLKFRRKPENVAGLQLCDLLAHPSHMLVRDKMGHDVSLGPFAEKVAAILELQKYDRSARGGRERVRHQAPTLKHKGEARGPARWIVYHLLPTAVASD